MFTPFLPIVMPQRADDARHVLVGGVEHVRPISASMLMPLIWMKRGLPSENTVPATDRSRSSVTTVSLM
jgi:hypothetical protein